MTIREDKESQTEKNPKYNPSPPQTKSDLALGEGPAMTAERREYRRNEKEAEKMRVPLDEQEKKKNMDLKWPAEQTDDQSESRFRRQSSDSSKTGSSENKQTHR